VGVADSACAAALTSLPSYSDSLYTWYTTRTRSPSGFELLEALLQYDPAKRLDAAHALDHAWFRETPLPTAK
jgi:serine/threonine protein kinase